jgi:hypothetical protein
MPKVRPPATIQVKLGTKRLFDFLNADRAPQMDVKMGWA